MGGVADRRLARGDGSRGPRAGRRTVRRHRALLWTPPGVASGDFSFIVIGDTGEGDASQHVLRDQLLSVANRPDVRFVVISSDVVYPTGSMKDYEAKFWLPFKGVTVPVYAIPGNHDWYDALEGFAATFFQRDAARASIRARAEADLRVTSTTDCRIEDLIQEAERLRAAYGVPTGFQRAPFFELQTDRFALIAVDTGTLRTIDAAQKSLARRGAEPRRRQDDDGDSRPSLLRRRSRRDAGRRGVRRAQGALAAPGRHHRHGGRHARSRVLLRARLRRAPAMHYFVNGGGGAYLSFGTSLDWPARAPTSDWAYYPDRAAVTRKNPGANALVETAGLVVDAQGSAPGRFPRSGFPPRSTTTSRRSSKASSRYASSGQRTRCA